MDWYGLPHKIPLKVVLTFIIPYTNFIFSWLVSAKLSYPFCIRQVCRKLYRVGKHIKKKIPCQTKKSLKTLL